MSFCYDDSDLFREFQFGQEPQTQKFAESWIKLELGFRQFFLPETRPAASRLRKRESERFDSQDNESEGPPNYVI